MGVGMRGQLSAEMLILITVVLAVIAIAAMQLMGTASDTGEKIDEQAEEMYERTSDAMKGKQGDFCTEDNDCINSCDSDFKCT